MFDSMTPIADVPPGPVAVFVRLSELLAGFAGVVPHAKKTVPMPNDPELPEEWFVEAGSSSVPGGPLMVDPFMEIFSEVTRLLPGQKEGEALATIKLAGLPDTPSAVNAYQTQVRLTALQRAADRARVRPRLLCEEFPTYNDLSVADCGPVDHKLLASEGVSWQSLIRARSFTELPDAIRRLLTVSVSNWKQVAWDALVKISVGDNRKILLPLDGREYQLEINAHRNWLAAQFWVRIQPQLAAAQYYLSLLPVSESAEMFGINGVTPAGFDILRRDLTRPLLPAFRGLVEAYGQGSLRGRQHTMTYRYVEPEQQELATKGLQSQEFWEAIVHELRQLHGTLVPVLYDPHIQAVFKAMESAFQAQPVAQRSDLPPPVTSYTRPLVVGFSGLSEPVSSAASFLHLCRRPSKIYTHEALTEDGRVQVTQQLPHRPSVVIRLDDSGYAGAYQSEGIGAPLKPEAQFSLFRSPLWARGERHRVELITIGDLKTLPIGRTVGLDRTEVEDWFTAGGQPDPDNFENEAAVAALQRLLASITVEGAPMVVSANRGFFRFRSGANGNAGPSSWTIQQLYEDRGFMISAGSPVMGLEAPDFQLGATQAVPGDLPDFLSDDAMPQALTPIARVESLGIPLVLANPGCDGGWEDTAYLVADSESCHPVSPHFPEVVATDGRHDWQLELLIGDGSVATTPVTLVTVLSWI